MRRYFWLLFLSCFCLSCSMHNSNSKQYQFDTGADNLSLQITDNMLGHDKKKIAVLPFLDLDGNISDFGKFLSDELVDRLVLTKKFGVVERIYLSNAIQKRSLTVKDLIGTNAAKTLGKILDADTMATGTYTVLAKTVKISARMVDVKTAEVFAVAKAEIYLDDDTMKMLELKRKPIGRWSEATEAVKQAAYDKHIKAALENIKKASQLDSVMTYERDSEKLFYKSALAELSIAVSIYPNDERALKMQQEIKEILGFVQE